METWKKKIEETDEKSEGIVWAPLGKALNSTPARSILVLVADHSSSFPVHGNQFKPYSLPQLAVPEK